MTEKMNVEEIWEQVLALTITEFYQFVEKLQEFMMEQQNAIKRYVSE